MTAHPAVRGLRRADLLASDPASVLTFHQALFGWLALQSDTGFDCWVGERRCASIRSARADEPNGWQLVFAGARQDGSLTGPDNTQAAMTKGRAQHGPFAPDPRTGEPCWIELHTADSHRADAFWTDTLHWTADADATVTTYASHGRPVATRVEHRVHDRWGWLCYFAVDGLDKASNRVYELGGRVLESAKHPMLGETLLIRDPEGAVCALAQVGQWGEGHRRA